MNNNIILPSLQYDAELPLPDIVLAEVPVERQHRGYAVSFSQEKQ